MAYTTNFMPSTNQGYDYGVGVYDQQQREEEERRRREQQANAIQITQPVSPDAVQVAAAPTATATDAGNLQMVGGKLRVNPAAAPAPEPQAVAPQAPMQAPPAMNAESLRAAQNAAAGQMPTAPVNPQQVQQQPAFLPEAGQFASTEQQTQDIAQSQAMDQFLAAQNDPFRLMELAKDTSQPESVRKLATEQAYRQLTNQREQSKAEEKIKSDTAKGDFLSVSDAIRGGRKGNEQGSWARYIMLKALDNDAAKVEGSKLGLFDTWTRATITDPVTQQQRSVQVLQSGTGKLLRGTDLQGNDLSPEDLNNAAVATNLGKNVTTTAETYIDRQGQRYSRQSDERGNIRLVNIQTGRPFTGNQNELDIERNRNAINRAIGQVTLDLAKKFGTNVLEAEAQYEKDQGVFGSASNDMTREEFRRQYNFSLNSPNMSTGTTPAAPAATIPPAAATPPAAIAPVVPPAATPPATQTQKPATAPVVPQPQTQTNRPVGGGTVSAGAVPQRKDYSSDTRYKQALEDYNRVKKFNDDVAAGRIKEKTETSETIPREFIKINSKTAETEANKASNAPGLLATIDRITTTLTQRPDFANSLQSPAFTAFVVSQDAEKQQRLEALSNTARISPQDKPAFQDLVNDLRKLEVAGITQSGLSASQLNTERESQRVVDALAVTLRNTPQSALVQAEIARAQIEYQRRFARYIASADPTQNPAKIRSSFDDSVGDKIYSDLAQKLQAIKRGGVVDFRSR